MKIILGPAAENEYYFERPHLDKLFLIKLAQSKNLSISAPRRIGKTSFMKHMVKTLQGFKPIYLITESINDGNEFFKKLYKSILSELSNRGKLKEFFDDITKRLDIKKLSLTEIEFGKSDIDYFKELLLLGKEMKKEDERFILFIDEFSQTIENLITDQGEKAAKIFLHQCRELRIEADLKESVHFIYTGSIGLENLVYSIDEAKAINDIGTFEIGTLTDDEAKELITQILDEDDYVFSEENQNYFLEKMKWNLPYFFHLIMSNIEQELTTKSQKEITPAIIDNAFEQSLKQRNYFEHWLSRLRIVLKGDDYTVAKEILNTAAKNTYIHRAEIADIAIGKNVDERHVLNILLHDAYLLFNKEKNHYHFASPLLQQWWLNNISI